MKTTWTKLIACLILAGVINATVVEPAFCFQHDDAVSQQQETGPCCVVCHPAHHQGIVPSTVIPSFDVMSSVDIVKLPRFFLSDSPTRSIFHPPLAF